MQLKGIWSDRTPFRKLIIITGIAIACIAILTLVATVLMKPLFGINAITNPSVLSNSSNPQVINAMKFLQLFNALGLFVLPPFLFNFLCESGDEETNFLSLKTKPQIIQLLLAGTAIIAAMPLINLMAEINSHLKFPESLSGLEHWMKTSEENAAVITQQFLKVDSVTGLLFNLFLIALLPGFGEELLFRGALQPLFTRQTNNRIAGIIIAAIVFSALHMQFYGFLPRMAMGVYFGFLLLWTKSLWVSVFAHFVNNASAVLASYFMGDSKDAETIGASANDWCYSLISVVIVGLITFYFYKNRKQE
ncbi:MAG: CPBP family intramembrane metalloprotease [Bacteroidia bacterium]|nr:CPBP family intramembrane metalloprotease [Bacteroidia bacterium]